MKRYVYALSLLCSCILLASCNSTTGTSKSALADIVNGPKIIDGKERINGFTVVYSRPTKNGNFLISARPIKSEDDRKKARSAVEIALKRIETQRRAKTSQQNSCSINNIGLTVERNPNVLALIANCSATQKTN